MREVRLIGTVAVGAYAATTATATDGSAALADWQMPTVCLSSCPRPPLLAPWLPLLLACLLVCESLPHAAAVPIGFLLVLVFLFFFLPVDVVEQKA